MTRPPLTLFLILVLSSPCVQTARILVVAFHDTGSHFKSMGNFLISLADAGHSVVLLDSIFKTSPFQHPNITRVIVTVEKNHLPSWFTWNWFITSPVILGAYARSDESFKSMLDQYEKEFRDLITPDWDLVVVDSLFANHGYAIATILNRRYGTPYVIYETACQLPDWNAAMWSLGWNPASKFYMYSTPSYRPHQHYDPRSLIDRAWSTANSLLEIFGFYYLKFVIDYPTIRRFGVPDFYWPTYLNGASLIFADRIDKFGWVRPTGTELIDIGAKCPSLTSKSSELPAELRSFVEDPESKGTIYIAFGSYANWTVAPDHVLDSFRHVFLRLRDYRIVFSFNGRVDELPDLPNLFLTSWAPQSALLQHPRTRLFVSHVGLKSLKEAICAAIPVLAIPMNAEQPYSGDQVVRMGIGRTLHKRQLTGPLLLSQIQELLTNSTYAQTARRLSTIFIDQPTPASTLALHKTNRLLRVGRHRIAFRRRGTQLKWIEFLYADLVFGLLVITTLLK